MTKHSCVSLLDSHAFLGFAVSRLRKLLTVGLILGLGIGLAWPFRTTGPQATNSPPEDARLITATAQRPKSERTSDSPTRHVVAKMASTAESSPVSAGVSTEPKVASFDLANHPAAIDRSGESAASPVTPTAPSAYAISNPGLATEDDEDSPAEVLHVVRNTDTLEKMAERYLGDASRALEIFDLNRDKLDNPHLLPIGAELRIPDAP